MITLDTDKVILPDGRFLFPCFTYYPAGSSNVNVFDTTGKVFNLNPTNTGLADQAAILAFFRDANVELCQNSSDTNPA